MLEKVKEKPMKKSLLIVACLFCIAGQTFAAQPQTAPQELELKQKACQNIFSFINIDLSIMSPRGTAADVNVVNSANTNSLDKKPSEPIVPICDKKCPKQPCPCALKTQAPPPPMPPKNKTSLFRLDLLHIFKIQIL